MLIDEVSAQYGFAGDNATVILTNVDLANIGIGTYIALSNAFVYSVPMLNKSNTVTIKKFKLRENRLKMWSVFHLHILNF